jgi:hypothetical protein
MSLSVREKSLVYWNASLQVICKSLMYFLYKSAFYSTIRTKVPPVERVCTMEGQPEKRSIDVSKLMYVFSLDKHIAMLS